MYPQATQTLPIDPDFTISGHAVSIFSDNTNAYDNFAILIGKLNDAPCQCITYHYNDQLILLQWLSSTNINPANIFLREECLAFSGEKRIKKWFAFLQKNVMLYADHDSINIYFTHDARKLVNNLCEYIHSLYSQHNSYAGKIYIMDEENAKITVANLRNRGEKELRFSDVNEKTFLKIVDAFNKNAKGVVVIAGEDKKAISGFIRRLTFSVSRRFVYVTQRDAPNLEYDFIDKSFGKGNNVFVVENAEEYPKIKDVYEESLAGYIQQLLTGKMKKAFNEPLIVTLNGSLKDFPELQKLKAKQLFLLDNLTTY